MTDKLLQRLKTYFTNKHYDVKEVNSDAVHFYASGTHNYTKKEAKRYNRFRRLKHFIRRLFKGYPPIPYTPFRTGEYKETYIVQTNGDILVTYKSTSSLEGFVFGTMMSQYPTDMKIKSDAYLKEEL